MGKGRWLQGVPVRRLLSVARVGMRELYQRCPEPIFSECPVNSSKNWRFSPQEVTAMHTVSIRLFISTNLFSVIASILVHAPVIDRLETGVFRRIPLRQFGVQPSEHIPTLTKLFNRRWRVAHGDHQIYGRFVLTD